MALFVCSEQHAFSSLPVSFQGSSWTDVIQYILSLGQYFLPKTNPGETPYYNVLPQFINTVLPGADKVEWTNDCFKTNQAWAEINAD